MIKIMKYGDVPAEEIFARGTAAADVSGIVSDIIEDVKKRGDDITFLRRIVVGGADQSFGIEVAKLAGVPDSVVKRAKVILRELEANAVKIEFKADDSVIEEDENDIQYNFTANGRQEIFEILKALDVNTITPIEAMQTLYDLKKKAQELS